MRAERRSGSDERRIVTGMIVDPVVLGAVAAKWDKDEGMFSSKWANLVGGWCVKFYDEYDAAPGSSIQGLFESWAEQGQKDKDTIDLVEKFLSVISNDYEETAKDINSAYILDLAGKHFNKVQIKRLNETVAGHIDNNDIKAAVRSLEGFSKTEIGQGAGIDVMNDQEAMRQAFETQNDVLIQYPGALGDLFRNTLERDGFISFLGPEKRGKSFWLIDMAWRAMCQRRRVAFFAVGDMSQNQMMRRFMTRAAAHPHRGPWPKTIRYPTAISRESSEKAEVDFEDRVFTAPLSWQEAYKACQETLQKKAKTKKSLLRLSVHPNDSISVNGIRAVCRGWERDGWVPDVIVIDYMDLLAPVNGADESREQINKTWKRARGLSQELHCLVISATQSNAASYSAELIDKNNFSEDKRKFAHVTGMIGLNATSGESEQGVMRLNWVVLREDEFVVTRCVHVAGCLALGNPAVRSTF